MIRITQGDNYPAITVNVTKNDLPLDLTDATAIFSMKHNITGHVYQEDCTISGNQVSWKFTTDSTVESGVYKGNIILNLGNGDEISIPNDEYISVVIKSPTDEVGAGGTYTPEYMKVLTYDSDSDGIIELADKLVSGVNGKSYSDISAEIDSDILAHKNNPTAHHSNQYDLTKDLHDAISGANTPSATNVFMTESDIGTYGDMLKSDYDSLDNGIVNSARVAPWSGITGKPSTFTATAHTHPTTDVTDILEYVQDTIGSTIKAGTQTQVSYDDTAGTVTISYVPSAIDHEAIEDIVAGLVTAGSGITVTYDDAADPATLTIALGTHTHSISNVTGLQTALDTKITSSALTPYFNKSTDTLDSITAGTTNKQFTDPEKTKLSGIYANADVTPADVFRKNTNTLDNITTGTTNVHFTSDYRTKLGTIDTGANAYVLPKAASGVLGGIKVGSRLSIDSNGVLSADIQSGAGDMMSTLYATKSGNNTTYPVDTALRLLNGTSTVAYSDIATSITSAISTHTANAAAHHAVYTNQNAIDAVTGYSSVANAISKAHSHTNSSILASITDVGSGQIITSAERTKLYNIDPGANAYVLPTATSSTLGGVKVDPATTKLTLNSGLIGLSSDVMLKSNYDKGIGSFDINYVVDLAEGLLSGSSAKTYSTIMSEVDQKILDHKNIPAAHHAVYTNQMAIDATKADTDVADAITKKHVHTNSSILSSITNAGSGQIMSTAERTKLGLIDDRANNYSLPNATYSSIGGVQIASDSGLSITNGVLSCTVGTGAGDMLKSDYVQGVTNNKTKMVDTARALYDASGDTTYTYYSISSLITSSLATHAGNATAHHTNTNDPTSDQKAALAGTAGSPSSTNKYVTNSDSRLSDTRTPSAHQHDIADIPDLETTYEPIISTKKTAFNVDFCTDPETETTGYAIEASDIRLTDSRTPKTHATEHAKLGTDSIKLDDLAEPDDNTDLNASTTKHGLMFKLNNTSTTYLDGTGNWSNPAAATISETFTRFEEGDLSTSTTFMPYMVTSASTITAVKGFIQVLPTGSNIRLDIRKNSASLTTPSNSIFSTIPEITTSLTILNGVYQFSFSNLDITNKVCAANDVLYFVITQVGSTSPGTGLFLKVKF